MFTDLLDRVINNQGYNLDDEDRPIIINNEINPVCFPASVGGSGQELPILDLEKLVGNYIVIKLTLTDPYIINFKNVQVL